VKAVGGAKSMVIADALPEVAKDMLARVNNCDKIFVMISSLGDREHGCFRQW
jgi:hypothetical protein